MHRGVFAVDAGSLAHFIIIGESVASVCLVKLGLEPLDLGQNVFVFIRHFRFSFSHG